MQEALGREDPKSIAHLMEIANKWADGEDSVRNDKVPSPEADRQQGSNGHRDRFDRRIRPRPYGGVDGVEKEATGFQVNRANRGTQQGENSREEREDGNFLDGNREDANRRRDFKPRGAWFEPPYRSPARQLNDPCRLHLVKDDFGNLRATHILKNCRDFVAMQAEIRCNAAATPALPTHAALPPSPTGQVAGIVQENRQ